MRLTMLYFKKPFNSMFVLMLMALTSLSSATPLETTKQNRGIIHFLNDKYEEKCTLAVPEFNQIFNFGASNEYCENNMVTAFWLEDVPSATLINFHSAESCSDGLSKDNFFIKFKTVKEPTDWGTPNNVTTVDGLRNLREGWLLPKKNVRIESTFVGADFNNKSLNEQLSCVYIERSQPVN